MPPHLATPTPNQLTPTLHYATPTPHHGSPRHLTSPRHVLALTPRTTRTSTVCVRKSGLIPRAAYDVGCDQGRLQLRRDRVGGARRGPGGHVLLLLQRLPTSPRVYLHRGCRIGCSRFQVDQGREGPASVRTRCWPRCKGRRDVE